MSDTIKTVLIDGGLPVALSDNKSRFTYNLLPVGEFYDKRYGHVSITGDTIQQMADNFGKCPAYEVPVKLGHSDGAKSPGKVIKVNAKPEGLEIIMNVDAETAKAINDKQYRYMSAEYDENYYDKKTGEWVGAVLLGAALVNQPAHPYVAPLVLADDIGKDDSNMTELEELRMQLSDLKAKNAQAEADLKAEREKAVKLSDENAKQLADLEAKNKLLSDERDKIANERDKMEAERNEAEVKAFCDKWLAEGITPAAVEMVKPLLLSKERTIKLGDDTEPKPTMKFFDEFFAACPKVAMGQTSKTDEKHVELSDIEKAIARGKAIADSANI